MNRTSQFGFTLVELSVTVAIIGILAAVGIPAYKDYLGKAQSSSPILLMDGLKARVASYQQTEGACPDNTASAIPAYSIAKSTDYVGQYVKSISVQGIVVDDGGCIITAKFKDSGVNGALKDKEISMRLFIVNSIVYKWTCYTTVEPVSFGLLPTHCAYQSHEDSKAGSFGSN